MLQEYDKFEIGELYEILVADPIEKDHMPIIKSYNKKDGLKFDRNTTRIKYVKFYEFVGSKKEVGFYLGRYDNSDEPLFHNEFDIFIIQGKILVGFAVCQAVDSFLFKKLSD